MDIQRLTEIREGRRGIALGLYIDVADDDWEDYSMTIPPVLALDEDAGRRVLDALRVALFTGEAQEIADDASDAVNIVLASAMKDQVLVARMLDSLCGRTDGDTGEEVTVWG
jgi:hypothetical protein